MIEVQLTSSEMLQAALVGCLRQVASLQADRIDQHGIDPEDGWRAHIEGALGEMALAKAINKYPSLRVNSFKGHDIAKVQVRTRSKNYYDLPVRQNDSANDIFVLVTGFNGRYHVHGWMRGADARRAEWLKDYGNREPAHFVPQAKLLSMQDFEFDLEIRD